MKLLGVCFSIILTICISTWAYAPIRMTPDEIEPEDRQVLSGVKYQKREVIEVKDYVFFTIERKREYYEVSFNVHDKAGEPLCTLSGKILTDVRYGYCEEYVAQIEVQDYEAPAGRQRFLSINIYDHFYDRYRLRGSKKVLLKT